LSTAFDDPRRTSCLLVAHPDDEVIFAGGLLLSSRCRWLVLIATHSIDSARGVESRAAWSALRDAGAVVEYELLGHRDAERRRNGAITKRRLTAQLRDRLAAVDGALVSHGSTGEYGHPGHRCVSQVALKVGTELDLDVYGFSSTAATNARVITDPAVLAQKAHLFRTCYSSQQAVWTVLRPLMVQLTEVHEVHALRRRGRGGDTRVD
jgi:LmbE family N-acetylglucosaminyl deacetylase